MFIFPFGMKTFVRWLLRSLLHSMTRCHCCNPVIMSLLHCYCLADDVTPSYVNNGELSSVCSPGSDVTISPSKVGNAGVEGEVEVRKKRFPMDRAYFIAKEMLMTERTYKKDLEVITVWYREEVCGQYPGPVQAQLLSLVDPLHAGHSLLLRELEGRLVTWEGRGNYRGAADYLRLGDVLLRHMDILPLYERYLEEHLVVLQQLEEVVQKETALAQLHHDFQLHKVCYLPLTALLLKPLHRLLHHEALLHRLLHHYGDHHPDLEDCRAARDRLACTTCSLPAVLRRSENYAQLCELQREVRGWDHLVQGSRQFLRQGCLMKLCRKGYQQRMFLLFSDVLVYASRSSTPPVRFHVHGHLAVHQLQVDGCPQHQGLGAAHGFTIRAPGRTMVVAAASRHDRDGWMEDLAGAIVRAGTSTTSLHHLGLRSCSSSEEGVDVPDACTSAVVPRDRDTDTREKAVQAPRSNTTVHVCWHRNTSISMADQLRAAENQLSGYLLRKFKNTSGWQKLWVVCTTFCLYFYKSHHDAAPLASLPLLGYEARTPAPADGIAKDYVVKLVYRNHVYYFRAESHYTFCRWMEVISCATQHCGRATPCSLQDS